jgi:7 transmembrane helices usually fused to an inactive transglutaminase/Inactive transglutaminase fused to 7 transmembrane helices
MTRRHLIFLTLTLTFIGSIVFLYKVLVLNFPLLPEGRSDTWEVEAHLAFASSNKPIKVSMNLPRNSHRFAIVNENFISRGYGVNVVTEDGKRKVHWSIRKARGNQNLYYRVSMRRMDRDIPQNVPQGSGPEKPDLKGAYREASESLVSEAREKSADIDGIVIELLHRLNSSQPGDNAALLLGKKDSLQKKVDLCVQLLALAVIHARSVHGIRLEDQRRDSSIIHWLEIYDQKQWVSYDPVSGKRGVPEDYLAWWRGMEPLVESQGTKNLTVTVSVSRSQELALQTVSETGELKKPFLLGFSLFSLPIETQAVYHVILMVPIGVFLLVILRNVIGIRTFGTFMPVLIALAFRETQLLWGIIFFSTLIALGLVIRLYLAQLKLLVVPRLAAILIVVIYLMALFSILTHKFGLERGLSVALFPMVIMTMTIERMSIGWEELGALEALKQGAWSMVAAMLAYLVMTIKQIEHLVFVFPELLLILLAGTLWLGRYTGFRLLELPRFKSLTKLRPDD